MKKICFLAGALLCVPVFAQLPSAAAPHVSEPHADVEMQTRDWKAANAQVGQFPRGHADVLNWERSMRTAAPQPDGSLGSGPELLQAASVVDEAKTLQTPEIGEAYFGYRIAYDLAVYYRDSVVPLRQLIHEEMLLRYSGMLASVWELLADTREQVLAVNNALEAQRDFWLAEADLQAALNGTSPGALAPSAFGASAEAPTSQGH